MRENVNVINLIVFYRNYGKKDLFVLPRPRQNGPAVSGRGRRRLPALLPSGTGRRRGISGRRKRKRRNIEKRQDWQKTN